MCFLFYLERNTDFKGQFMGRPKTQSSGAAGPAPCPLPSKWYDAIPCCVHYKDSLLEAAKESGLKTNVPKLKNQMPSVQSVSLNTHISGEKKATTTHRTLLAIHGNSSFVQMSGK